MVLTGSLDLFVLMVEYLCGSVLLSLIVWALILLVTGILGRLSVNLILIVLACYLVAASVGYIGAIGLVIVFPLAAWYMVGGIINSLNQPR